MMARPTVMSALAASLLSVALTLFATAAFADEIGAKLERVNPHDFKRADMCSVCHTAEPPALLLDPVTTCVKCHPGNIGNHPVTRHPMGKMSRIKIPSYLPLTEDGEMVCYTCHDPHKKTKFPKMLRIHYFGLCMACHVGY